MRPAARIVHSMPGRLRFRLPAMRGECAYFEDLSQRLRLRPEIVEVTTNPLTGGVLIEHQGLDTGELLDWGRDEQLFDLDLTPAAATAESTLAGQSRARLQHFDAWLKQATGNSLDAASLMLLLLASLILRQLWRGEVAAPAVSLLWYVMEMSGITRQSDGRH